MKILNYIACLNLASNQHLILIFFWSKNSLSRSQLPLSEASMFLSSTFCLPQSFRYFSLSSFVPSFLFSFYHVALSLLLVFVPCLSSSFIPKSTSYSQSLFASLLISSVPSQPFLLFTLFILFYQCLIVHLSSSHSLSIFAFLSHCQICTFAIFSFVYILPSILFLSFQPSFHCLIISQSMNKSATYKFGIILLKK